MFRMYASNSHSYTHLILALGIVREPIVWGFITSQYPCIHDTGLPSVTSSVLTPRWDGSALPGTGIASLSEPDGWVVIYHLDGFLEFTYY